MAVTTVEPTSPFKPLDPDTVSLSIPAFFIGRNRDGFWVARDSAGRVGGLFLFRTSAVRFARAQSEPLQCALIFPKSTIELDLKNHGNPLIGWLPPALAWLLRAIERRVPAGH